MTPAERKETLSALRRARGNQQHAAAMLGVHPQTMWRRANALRSQGCKIPAYRRPNTAPRGDLGVIARARATAERKERDDLERRLAEAEGRLRLIGAAREHLDTIRIAPAAKGKLRPAVAVALASDWHVEEPVEADKVFGKNAYDLKIAEARARSYFQGLLWKIRHHSGSYDIKRLLVLALGDFISGHIHPELVETAQASPSHAIAFWVELFAGGIRMLLDETDLQIDVVCEPGNHGRTGEKITVSTRVENSFEWLGFLLLAERFKGERRVHFELAKGSHVYVEIWDWIIRGTHGDDVRYGGGVGGLAIPLHKACDAWNDARRADYTCLGHFHQLKNFGFAVVNGSLIGYSPYAIAIKARYEPPAQGMFLIDRERGLDYFSPIWVDEQGRRG